MGVEFEGIDLRIFEEVASRNPLASTDELWKLLSANICNDSQILSIRSQFMTTRWNERKESIQKYVNKLQNTAINLPQRAYLMICF